ncbi:MAG: hypothetical protein ACLP1X_09595 [Polyangiaceae bacterium]
MSCPHGERVWQQLHERQLAPERWVSLRLRRRIELQRVELRHTRGLEWRIRLQQRLDLKRLIDLRRGIELWERRRV